MTGLELCELITRRVILRSREEPDPASFIARAVAHVMVIQQHCPVEKMEDALIEFGREFGVLVQGVEKPG